jgi:hypothetical protein
MLVSMAAAATARVLVDTPDKLASVLIRPPHWCCKIKPQCDQTDRLCSAELAASMLTCRSFRCSSQTSPVCASSTSHRHDQGSPREREHHETPADTTAAATPQRNQTPRCVYVLKHLAYVSKHLKVVCSPCPGPLVCHTNKRDERGGKTRGCIYSRCARPNTSIHNHGQAMRG